MDIRNVTENDVAQVYKGRQGCMCGCNGKYWINPDHKETVDSKRGYEMPAPKTHMKMVRKVLEALKGDPRTTYEEPGIFVLDVDDKTQVLYTLDFYNRG